MAVSILPSSRTHILVLVFAILSMHSGTYNKRNKFKNSSIYKCLDATYTGNIVSASVNRHMIICAFHHRAGPHITISKHTCPNFLLMRSGPSDRRTTPVASPLRLIKTPAASYPLGFSWCRLKPSSSLAPRYPRVNMVKGRQGERVRSVSSPISTRSLTLTILFLSHSYRFLFFFVADFTFAGRFLATKGPIQFLMNFVRF